MSSSDVVYLLDTNVFIQAKNSYYAFDLCPAFWASIAKQFAGNRLFSIVPIKEELTVKKKKGQIPDELSEWASKTIPSPFFKSVSEDSVIDAFSEMQQWANDDRQQFKQPAKIEFASVTADAWLVAYAKAKGLSVVTHEVYDANNRKKIKIPNVCEAFDVPYCDTFEMLRSLGVRFV